MISKLLWCAISIVGAGYIVVTLIHGGAEYRDKRERAERTAVLEESTHQLSLCRLELQELVRTRDIRLAKYALERPELPQALRERLPTLQAATAEDERSKAAECQSLTSYRADLVNGVPLNAARESHVNRLTRSSLEMIKGFKLGAGQSGSTQ